MDHTYYVLYILSTGHFDTPHSSCRLTRYILSNTISKLLSAAVFTLIHFPAGSSVYGYQIAVQLVAKHRPDLFVQNMDKVAYEDILCIHKWELFTQCM